MRLRFAKEVPMEQRQFLRRSLNDYERRTQMTDAEREELYAWVSAGNDVCSNPGNLASESGCEMDFISGIRADAERFAEHDVTMYI